MAKAKNKGKGKASADEIPSAPPVFDVSKPGKTAADPSSRPLIVTHKPMVKQDPMVAPEADENEKKKPLTPKREVVVQPSEELANEKSEKTPEEEKTPREDKPEDSTPYESNDIESLAGEAQSKQKAKKEDEEIAKKAAEIENLIQSKKYNLPIHDGAYASRSIFATLLNILLIVLALATIFVLAVDAGMVDVGLELPFDLIK